MRVIFILTTLAASCATPDPYASVPLLSHATYERYSSAQIVEATYPFVDAGNKDFNRFVAVCDNAPLPLLGEATDAPCTLDRDALLLVDAEGPGVLGRFWITAAKVLSPPSWDRERIVIIRDKDVLLDQPLQTLMTTGHKQFVPPLAGETSGAWLSAVPISYSRRLQVALVAPDAAKSYYYLADTRRGDARAAAAEALLDLPSERRTKGERHEGQTLAISGEGTIVHLTLTGASRLTLDFDGARTAELSTDALRAYSAAPFTSAFARFDGDETIVFALPMPFRRGATLSVDAGTLTAIVSRQPLGEDALTLHAVETTLAPGLSEAPLLVREGKGKIAGVTMRAQGHRAEHAFLTPSPWNFLETDDVLDVDGVRHQGTGSEDYFGAGFYFANGPFARPFVGVPELYTEASSARFSGYRWHAPFDAITYKSRVTFGWERAIGGEALVDALTATVFFYE
ncbi:MAG: DUF2961 domain-containing protein [Deltaproteobacteria bacterium]|nr:DUF2961 domain-containing protein [Deltaproteobacteria bacterium]